MTGLSLPDRSSEVRADLCVKPLLLQEPVKVVWESHGADWKSPRKEVEEGAWEKDDRAALLTLLTQISGKRMDDQTANEELI